MQAPTRVLLLEIVIVTLLFEVPQLLFPLFVPGTSAPETSLSVALLSFRLSSYHCSVFKVQKKKLHVRTKAAANVLTLCTL